MAVAPPVSQHCLFSPACPDMQHVAMMFLLSLGNLAHSTSSSSSYGLGVCCVFENVTLQSPDTWFPVVHVIASLECQHANQISKFAGDEDFLVTATIQFIISKSDAAIHLALLPQPCKLGWAGLLHLHASPGQMMLTMKDCRPLGQQRYRTLDLASSWLSAACACGACDFHLRTFVSIDEPL